MKLINDPFITRYLMQASMLLGPTDITQFVAMYMADRLKYDNLLFDPVTMQALDMNLHVELPYELTKRLFGTNFLGLLEGKGIDRSDMIETFEARIAKHKDGVWGPCLWSVGLDIDVYYGDPNCMLAIKLDRVDVFTRIATRDPVLSKPKISIIAKIVVIKDGEEQK